LPFDSFAVSFLFPPIGPWTVVCLDRGMVNPGELKV
jgi:hypothetical protein